MITVLKWLKSLREPKEKRIAFIDGDQVLDQLLNAYSKHVAETNTETHFIKLGAFDNTPKKLKKFPEINEVYLTGFTKKKEVTDKYIAAFINKAINEGYNHITVISSDYDFIDIFKMAVILDDKASKLVFRMIMPKMLGRASHLPSKIANIEIIKG
jgi:predicted RNA-binding protein with PIN domain